MLRKSIFDKTGLGNKTLTNRLVVAPMTRNSATNDGVPTADMEAYYAAFAAGGFGMIITEGTYTDDLYSRANESQPGLVTTEQQHGWSGIVDKVHASGAIFIAQLMHAGALSDYQLISVAPSPVQPVGLKTFSDGSTVPFSVPKKMNDEDMEKVKEGFVNAAIRAEKAGFDGIEIHAANGYLFDQFITEYTNTRTDEYGGDTRNRLRFLMEVYHAIRENASSDFIVGIRLSESKVNDLTYRWPAGSNTALEIFEIMKDVKPDYIHIAAEGGNWARECLYDDGFSSTGIAKKVTNVPVIANGGLHDVKLAEALLETDQADLIAIGRAAIASPNWPNLIQNGKKAIPFFKELIKPSLTLKHTKEVLQRQELVIPNHANN